MLALRHGDCCVSEVVNSIGGTAATHVFESIADGFGMADSDRLLFGLSPWHPARARPVPGAPDRGKMASSSGRSLRPGNRERLGRLMAQQPLAKPPRLARASHSRRQAE
jgi:hypothetical protein